MSPELEEANPLQIPTDIPVDENREEFFEYDKARIRINQLISEWSTLIAKAESRRKERYTDLDIEALRQSGDIQEDETFIPDRIIDTNIMREKPDYMSFLKQSNRLAIFRCIDDPRVKTDKIEIEFTEGLTYKGWYRQFDRLIDGALLHGWDSIEVVYDPNKPLKVCFEHIGHDRLYFNTKVSDIQDSEFVLRRYDSTVMRLESFVAKNGFDAEQVAILTEKNKQTKRRDEIITYFKGFFKYQEVVYVFWYSQDGQLRNWLKAPEKLRLGLQVLDSSVPPNNSQMLSDANNFNSSPALLSTPSWVDQDLNMVPTFLFLYKDDESETIVDHKGRAFLDGPVQEAATAITSAHVNGTLRASNVYGSPETDDGESSEVKQLDIQLMHGGLYNRPIKFFRTEYPDSTNLQALGYLGAHNSQQTGKVNFAVMNRKDSRKTAEELEQSKSESSRLGSTNIAGFSEFVREFLSFTWLIVKSQALQNKVDFLQIEQDITMPSPAGPIPTGQTELVNDMELIDHLYELRPAGDIDVVKRQETLQQMMQDWPVIQSTPLAQQFLLDFISLRYPEQASKYMKILQEGDQGKNLVMALSTLLQGALTPEEITAMPPEMQAKLQQIQQQVVAYLQPQPTAKAQ